MKVPNQFRPGEAGNALVITMLMLLAALVTVAGILSWSRSTNRLTDRSNQYARCVAAAEASTEKVMSQMNSDFLAGGEALVINNVVKYSTNVLSSSDSSYWADWQFQDGRGHANRTFVNASSVSNFTVMNGAFAGLFGFISTYAVVSDATQPAQLQSVTAGSFQEVQFTRIPIFQFGMYSADDMEISCGQPFFITGRVHSNGSIYTEPDNVMSFGSEVTAANNILFSREPLDNTRGPPAGSVVYLMGAVSNAPPLTLPLGTTNASQSFAQIIQPPPSGEDPLSAVGRLRYYNQVDMIVAVTATSVVATSGRFNSFATVIPTNEVSLFVKTNKSFYDWREGKTVISIDINVGKLTTWSATNQNLRTALGTRDVSSIYVYDTRPASSTTLPVVRVWNGLTLPPLGLTVATSRPLYVWGNYNQYNSANLNGTNTLTTMPASLVADAITILSPSWVDTNSTSSLSSRVASSNTVNAALLAGAVYTTLGQYSGGMENFQRFLEDWSSATYTYNGSLVKMFASIYATNAWGKGNVYNPPTRAYNFDPNFNTAALLPPLAPGMQTIFRSRWATLAAGQTTPTVPNW